MAETGEKQQQQAIWDAALERLGRDVVRDKLNTIGASLHGTSFPLNGLPEGMRPPKCEYVEAWVARTGAAETAAEAKRDRQNLALAVLGIAVAVLGIAVAIVFGIVTVWPVVRDWIK